MIVKKMTHHVQMVRAWTHYVTVTTVTEDVIAKFQVSFFICPFDFPITISQLEHCNTLEIM